MFTEKTLDQLHTKPLADALKELLATKDHEPFFTVDYEGVPGRFMQFGITSEGDLILDVPRQGIDGEEWNRAVEFFKELGVEPQKIGDDANYATHHNSSFTFKRFDNDTFRAAAMAISVFNTVFQISNGSYRLRSQRYHEPKDETETPSDAAEAQAKKAISLLSEKESEVLYAAMGVGDKFDIHMRRATTMLSEMVLNYIFLAGDSKTAPFNVIATSPLEYDWYNAIFTEVAKLPGESQFRVCGVLLLASSYAELLAQKAIAFDATNDPETDPGKLN